MLFGRSNRVSSMATYTLYCFSDAGKMTRLERLDAADDEEAVMLARYKDVSARSELWLQTRLVGMVAAYARA